MEVVLVYLFFMEKDKRITWSIDNINDTENFSFISQKKPINII